MAPERAAAVLRGPGEVHASYPWGGPELAALLAGASTEGPIAGALREADAVVAFTRSEPLLATLAPRTRRLLAHDPTPPEAGPHAAVWLAKGIEPLGVVARHDPLPLAFTDAERGEASSRALGLPEAFLAVHPGSGSPAKNWPADRFFAAARQLAAGEPWLLVLGPAEEALTPPPRAVAAREWPLRRLGALLSRASLFLGNDAGVSHLAAAAGAPTLALYGPTDPRLWAPVGRRVVTLRSPSLALGDLTLEQVMAAARTLRSEASGPPSG